MVDESVARPKFLDFSTEMVLPSSVQPRPGSRALLPPEVDLEMVQCPQLGFWLTGLDLRHVTASAESARRDFSSCQVLAQQWRLVAGQSWLCHCLEGGFKHLVVSLRML